MNPTSVLKIATFIYCFSCCFAQSEAVGSTKVTLNGNITDCRSYGCNFGNLIVDAMIDYNVRAYKGGESWTDAAIAIHNSGSIAGSIKKSSPNEISDADLHAALPYKDQLVKMNLTGQVIRNILEHSVNYSLKNGTCVYRNAFLHFSGLVVNYKMDAQAEARINSVMTRCAQCRVPEYALLDNNTNYAVIMTDHIANGGDGYTMLQNFKKIEMGVTVEDAVRDYLTHHSPVYPGIDRRMTFMGANKPEIMKNCIVEKSRVVPSDPEDKTGSGNREVYGTISIIFPLIVARFFTM